MKTAELMTVEEFRSRFELKGAGVSGKNRLKIGFSYGKATLVLSAVFSKQNGLLEFMQETVQHLNREKKELACPFCQKTYSHLSPCQILRQTDHMNLVIEAALEKIEASLNIR